MADITDPIVVTAVGTLRQVSDALVGLKAKLDYVKEDYTSNVQATVNAADVADLIVDGQPITSGRPQLDIAEVKQIAASVNTILTALDANYSTLVKASVNPRSPF